MKMEEVSGNRKMQYFATLAVSLAAMTSGVSIYWSTPMLPKFHDNETGIYISDGDLSWMVSMSSPGIMAGSLASSFIADKFGRRPALLGSALPIALGTTILLFASKPWMLYIMRFLWGCGAGIYFTISSIYVVEIADKNIRGLLTVGMRFIFNFGSFSVMAIGPFVDFRTFNYALLVLPIAYFAACWAIPETPYYLLKEGKVDTARKELQRLKGYKDDKVLDDQLNQMKADVKKEMRHSGTIKELFTGRQYRKAIIISVGIKLTQVMAGSIPILQYLGRIMQESKTDIQVSTALIIFGAVRFVVGIFSSMLADKVGRRPLLISSYIGTGVFLAIVGSYFYCLEVIGMKIDSSNPLRFMTLTGIICANIISTLGFDSLMFVVTAEVFPINVKSIAMTALNIFGGCCSFVAVRGYQVLKELSGLYGVFWFFAASALLGAAFSFFVVPEMKGKSLRQIQMELQGADYDDEAGETLNKVVSTTTENDKDENKELMEKSHVEDSNKNE